MLAQMQVAMQIPFVVLSPLTGVFADRWNRCSATLQIARSMGLKSLFGSLEPSKVANLFVLDGDPFEDCRLMGSPVGRFSWMESWPSTTAVYWDNSMIAIAYVERFLALLV